eukprot:scaffold321892_cov12-Tisochrysis_lutea.AAC.1
MSDDQAMVLCAVNEECPAKPQDVSDAASHGSVNGAEHERHERLRWFIFSPCHQKAPRVLYLSQGCEKTVD